MVSRRRRRVRRLVVLALVAAGIWAVREVALRRDEPRITDALGHAPRVAAPPLVGSNGSR